MLTKNLLPRRVFIGVILLLVLSVVPSFGLSAPSAAASGGGTAVSGAIVENTTWSPAGGIYVVTGSVLVMQGVTLTILPGTVVAFNSGLALQIDGQLIARGTAGNMITFTSSQPTPAPGDWGYILFTSTSVGAGFDVDGSYANGSILEYCVVEYAGGVGVSNNGAIRLNSAYPFINHSTIINNANPGINGWNLTGNLKISNNVISNNRYGGIKVNSNATIKGNTISNSTAADHGGGIRASNSIISNNVIHNNAAAYHGGGINATNSTITYNTVSNNTAGWSGGGIYADSSTISNNIVINNTASDGGGIAGSSTISNNTIANNIAGHWGGGIASSGVVSNNTIVRNSAGTGSAIYYDGSNFNHNTLAENSNYTVYLNSRPLLNYNNFLNSTATYELWNNNAQGTPNVNAENNWWGTAATSEIQGKIFDWFDIGGSAVSIVDFSPYLNAPDTAAPPSPPTGLITTLGASSIALSWNANPESDITGYRVYYGNTPGFPYQGTGATQGNSPLSVGNITSFSLSGITGSTIYIAVTAGDGDGNESWYSLEKQVSVGGSISGYVYRADGTTPIAGARVGVFEYGVPQPNSFGWVTADSAGHYNFGGLASGQYSVRAEAEGYATEWYQDIYYMNQILPVSVTLPNETANINFSLVEGGSILGYVYQADGTTPVAGADLIVCDSAPVGGRYITRHAVKSGTDGSYKTGGLPTGQYKLWANAEGYATEFYDDSYHVQGSTNISITSPADVAGINFNLDPGGSISGYIYQADATTPISGAYIDIFKFESLSGTWLSYGFGRSGTDGSYKTIGLPAGQYGVRATATGYATEWFNNAPYKDSAIPVSVTVLNDTPNINFNLDPGGTISGHIYQSDGTTPISGAQVDVYRHDSLPASWISYGGITASADGSFRTLGLPAGQYAVRARLSGYANKWYNNTYYKDFAAPVTVTAPGDTPNINISLEPGGSISGYVYQTDGTTPLSNVTVTAYDATNWRWVNNVRTDATGHYVIPALPARNYFVSVSAPAGFANEYYDNTYVRGSAIPVTVAAPADTPNINFTLEAGGTIAGNVTAQASGLPVANVSLDSSRMDGPGGAGANTDVNGNYTINGLPYGQYRVNSPSTSRHVSGDDNYIRKYYNNKPDSTSIDLITISAESPNATGINFALEVGGSLSGFIYEADGTTPILGATVTVYNFSTNVQIVNTTTGADGSYTAYGLATGQYRVNAWTANHVRKNWQNAWFSSQATPVQVNAPDNTPNINFSLEAGGTISGSVAAQATGLPQANVSIDATRVDGTGNWWGNTDANGNYTYTGMPLGQYRISAPSTGRHLSGDDNFIRESYNNKATSDIADIVTLSTDSLNASGINFSLDMGSAITGHVYQSDGVTPISGATVGILIYDDTNPSNMINTNTDASGYYRFSGLLPGQYAVRTTLAGYARVWYNNVPAREDATPVTVVVPGDTPNIDFSLELGGTLSGHIYKSDGTTPVQNALVLVHAADGRVHGAARTGADGSYVSSGLHAGSYKASAELAGFVTEWYQNASSSDAATPIAITISNDTPNINFTLDTIAGSSISGRVLDELGNPIANAYVDALVYETNQKGWHTETDASGNYTLTGVPSGNYRVIVWKDGRVRRYWQNALWHHLATPVVVTAPNNVADINFALEPGGTIAGNVIDQVTSSPLANVSVDAGRTDGDGGSGATTDANGNYTITGLPFGQYRVNSPSTGRHESGDDYYAREYYNSKTSWDGADLVAISTSSPNATAINFSLEVGGSMSGRVFESSGGNIQGARIDVSRYDPQKLMPPERTVYTDTNGLYQVTGLSSESYRVQAWSAGKVREFYKDVYDARQSTTITVSAPGETSGIDFTLEPGGSISGTVTAQGVGTPLANVSLDAASIDGTYNWGTTTDQNGNYTLIGLPFGQYRVNSPSGGRWGSGDSNYLIKYYNNKTTSANADLITISSGSADVTGINFNLEAGASISGIVTDQSTGGVLQDASIGGISLQSGWHKLIYRQEEIGGGQTSRAAFKAAGDTAWRWFSTSELQIKTTLEGAEAGILLTTKKNTWTNHPTSHAQLVQCVDIDSTSETGWYGQSVVNIISHEENIHGNDDNYTSYYEAYFYVDTAGTWWFSTDSDDASEIVIDDNVVAYWYEGHGAMGRWENKARVTIVKYESGEWVNDVGIAADGSYSIRGLSAGNYRLQARASGYATEFYQDKHAYSEANAVVVNDGANTPNINFTMERAGSLSGHVYQADGVTPISGAAVAAAKSSNLNIGWLTTTDSSGYYQFNMLPSDNYYAISVSNTYAAQWYNNVYNVDQATQVTVTAPNDTPNINFRLVPGGTMSGHAYKSDGITPISGATIWILDTQGRVYTGGGTLTDGSYKTYGLLPGSYKIKAEAPGYVAEWYNNATTIDQAAPVNITVGSDTPGIDFTLDVLFKLAFASNRSGNLDIFSMSLDGSNLTQVTNNTAWDNMPALSPDGTKIAFSSRRDGNREIYVKNADGTGTPIRLTDNSTADYWPTWSADKIAFVSGRDGNDEIYSMNADGTNQVRLTSNTTADRFPAWSKDGTRIAFASGRDTSNVTMEIYTMNADGTNQTRLTNNTVTDRFPDWSPDSGRIAFTTDRDGNYEIYTMNADGTNPARLTNNTIGDYQPVWLSGYDKIVFTSERDGNAELYIMNADGSNQTRLTTNTAGDWSKAFWTGPSVVTTGFANLTGSSVILSGNLTSLGSASVVSAYFEWGTTTAYGNRTSTQSMSATGAFSDSLTGLLPNTTYHFRARGDGDGGGWGSDMFFTTSPATLTSIQTTPFNPIVWQGKTMQFQAIGTYTDGSTRDLTSLANWSSSQAFVATINATGLATAVSNGKTAIIASYNGVSSNVQILTVISIPMQSIVVKPAKPFVPAGVSQQFTALAIFADMSSTDVTATATWTSSDTDKATIGVGTGLAQALVEGQAIITATYSGFSGNTVLTVEPASPGIITIAAIKANPAAYDGQMVKLSGEYRGTERGYGSQPVTRGDWVLKDATGNIFVTGNSMGMKYPADVGKSIMVDGTVRTKNGVPYIEAAKPTAAISTRELKVGIIAPVTGPAAAKGMPGSHGIMDAMEYINSELSGASGFKIKPLLLDSAYNPTQTVNHVNTLMAEGAVLFTTMSSMEMSAAKSIANSNGFPGIAAYATPSLYRPPQHVYGQMPDYGDDWVAFASYYMSNIWQGTGRPKMALHFLNNSTGYSVRDAARAMADSMGIDVVATEEHTPTTTSELDSLTRIKAQNPDVLFISSTPSAASVILKNAHDLGINITIGLSHAGFTNSLIDLAGASNVEGIYGALPTVLWDENLPGMAKAKQYLMKNHPADSGNLDYLACWSTSLVVAEALRLAVQNAGFDALAGGNLSAWQAVEEQGIKRLNGYSVGGLQGSVSYAPGDNRLSKQLKIYRITNVNIQPVTGWIEAPVIRYEDYPWWGT